MGGAFERTGSRPPNDRHGLQPGPRAIRSPLPHKFENSAAALAIKPQIVHVTSPDEYEPTIKRCASEAGCALILLDDGMFTRKPEFVAALARKHRVPAMYTNFGYVRNDGGLISYGINLRAMYMQSTDYMDRILKGERPEHLPVQTPIAFRLGINSKTAEAIGLSVPPTLLARADEVIE